LLQEQKPYKIKARRILQKGIDVAMLYTIPKSSIKVLKLPKVILEVIFEKNSNYTNNQLKELYQTFVGIDTLLDDNSSITLIKDKKFVYLMPESKYLIKENRLLEKLCASKE